MTRVQRPWAAFLVPVLIGCLALAAPSPGLRHLALHRTAATLDPPSDERRLTLARTIGGDISPKSVGATGLGRVFAQNMMYRHTVTVYGHRGNLVKTISDGVRLSRFGVSGHPGISHGAPVEVAFSPDHTSAYVSNYSMYGAGFGPEGSDVCTPSSAKQAGVSRSFVYRISLAHLRINGVKRVGRVPKYLAVTPDGHYLIVSNWCSYSLSIIDLHKWRRVATIPIGAYPRGIAVFPNSRKAYVAVMGSTQVAVVDLRSFTVIRRITVGSAPRHVVLDPRGHYLYVSLNGEGRVVKVDRRLHRVVDSVATGSQPRSMAIAPDGRSLYVVNYESGTLTKVRTGGMRILQTVSTGTHPIGVTYEPSRDKVWVAVYTGHILVYKDR